MDSESNDRTLFLGPEQTAEDWFNKRAIRLDPKYANARIVDSLFIITGADFGELYMVL
jgi:hypothetical protein